MQHRNLAPMPTCTLTNRRKVMLPPIHVPELGTVPMVLNTIDRNRHTGDVGRRKITRHTVQAVTLCAAGTPGSVLSGLPEGTASSPEVLAAKARGDILVTIVSDPAAEPAIRSAFVTLDHGEV